MSEDMGRGGGWIQTFTKKRFYPLAPRADEIDIEDIAQGLSNLCRFSGQSNSFYSVAQHSVYVSHLCDPKDALYGLLHDATEAYLGDASRPVKHSGLWDFYREAESRLMAEVCIKFGLPLVEPQSVKNADSVALGLECKSLLGPLIGEGWERFIDMAEAVRPGFCISVGFGPTRAREFFMQRYHELTER